MKIATLILFAFATLITFTAPTVKSAEAVSISPDYCGCNWHYNHKPKHGLFSVIEFNTYYGFSATTCQEFAGELSAANNGTDYTCVATGASVSGVSQGPGAQ